MFASKPQINGVQPIRLTGVVCQNLDNSIPSKRVSTEHGVYGNWNRNSCFNILNLTKIIAFLTLTNRNLVRCYQSFHRRVVPKRSQAADVLVVLIPNRWDPIVETICYKRFPFEIPNLFGLTFLEYFSNSSRDLKRAKFSSIFQQFQTKITNFQSNDNLRFCEFVTNDMHRTNSFTVHLSKHNLYVWNV